MINTVIITAGGSGKRFNSETPKQFHLLDGLPIIVRTIFPFQYSALINNIVIVVESKWFQLIEEYKHKYNLSKIADVVQSGAERQDSLFNAMKSEIVMKSDYIAIHDAVRPFVSRELIQVLFDEVQEKGAIFPGLMPKETIKQKNNAEQYKTLQRSELIAVQTPEVFKTELLLDAVNKAIETGFIGTDTSSLLENAGSSIYSIEGDERNIKITTQLDFTLAELILRSL